ncbi:glucose-6-phosphate isomerase [Candidatus Aminicenantes bacterium AC-708-M15]|jgi:glucose-6-phosphate isomerase|nr:glucose-6-phosphate isomerase [SCandidatus Aminicenantes bacterium Aminicenantia_JdfR_composite]MCP2596596.1 glucose-6-phosphate isomerase [Candidatus Aminicenantes bacterium AC-335-G13]MCP2598195.1 glucose-6-phosphate isomerase [Candidatus Aminicenantes bacterium AC-335-L06]MCP2604433.1 glucose-6-phosphate isomerase [Candidatus Aminicenantes bacterium AC-708-M15]MCP2619531.1 glucose-6-phosphate isomerase [Candidatus Aminicenantes bacterium AC-335-K20]
MEKIIFDYTFSLSPPLDIENGLQLENIKSRYNEAISSLKNLLRKNPGFLNLPSINELNEMYNFAIAKEKLYENIVLIGIGGSSLGFQAISQALLSYYHNLFDSKERNGKPRVFFLDNIDPYQINPLTDLIDFSKTLFFVISKSGKTTETLATFLILREKIQNELGNEGVKDHIIVITENKSDNELLKLSIQEKYKVFPFPEHLGGRYSALSIVALLPLCFLKINPQEIIKGAKSIKDKITSPDPEENPSLFSALIYLLFYKKGKKIQIIMPYSSKLEKLGEWYCQLWAESLGKKYTIDGQEINWGQTPVRVLGTKDQHSQIQLYMEGPRDKIITFWEIDSYSDDIKIPQLPIKFSSIEYLENRMLSQVFKAEKKATEIALAENNRPSVTFILPELNPYYIGQFILMLEMQTALAGEMLNINPFDQPGVELGKKYTFSLLNRKGYKKPDLLEIKHYRI